MRRITAAFLLATLFPAPAPAAVPTCALVDPGKEPRAALLEAKLLAEPGATWVERAGIDKVLAEQKLQAMFSPQGVGERVRLGRLLKADVLVLVRAVKGAEQPTLEIVVSETASGLRLLVRAVPLTKDADADITALLAATHDGIRRHGEKVAEVVAVPPFVSRDLELAHDHLKGAFAKLAESVALDRKGVVVVEFEEAEALARELALAAPGARLNRPPPLYLIGEYRHEGKGKDRTVAIRLRAERAGKPVGKALDASLKADESPAAVQKWSASILDGFAKDDKPWAPADPKVEAKLLVERAVEFARLANWTEALALAEASLLLDPAQVDLRAHAVRALSPLIRIAWQRGQVEYVEAERYARLYRRGLEHLEAFHALGGDVSRYREKAGPDFASDFLSAANGLLYSGSPSQKVIDLYRELRNDHMEALLRMAPNVAKNGKAGEAFYISRAIYFLSPREKYERLDKIIAELRDLPELTKRVVAYASQGYVAPPDTPEYRAFLDRLSASKDKALQDAASELREKLKANAVRIPPPMGDPTGPGPGGVRLTPVSLSVARDGPGGSQPLAFEGILAVGPGSDVIWSTDALLVMKEKGKLRLVWQKVAEGDERSRFSTVVFDGRYVWATLVPTKSSPILVVFDSQTEKAWDVSAADGLPQPPKREVAENSVTMQVAPLEPGRACLAGSFLNRAWIAIATFDPATGNAVVKVIHEARDAQDRADKEQWAKTTVGFSPSFLHTLNGKPGPDGKPNRRVLVGRSAQENFTIRDYPLVVDPDSGTVQVLKERLLSGVNPKQCAMIGGDLYFVAPLEARYQLRRIGLPGLTSELVSRVPSIFAQPGEGLAAHDGRLHIILDEGLKRDSGPGVKTQLSRQYQWWTADQDGKNVRQVANGLTWVNGIGVSSHYGLIAWTGKVGGQATLNLVEFPPIAPKR